MAKQIKEQRVAALNVGDGGNIYRDGTYLRNNPTLHGEDTDYKFNYIRRLLKRCAFAGPSVRILDVGGGGGAIAALLCEHLAQQGLKVECHAFDLS